MELPRRGAMVTGSIAGPTERNRRLEAGAVDRESRVARASSRSASPLRFRRHFHHASCAAQQPSRAENSRPVSPVRLQRSTRPARSAAVVRTRFAIPTTIGGIPAHDEMRLVGGIRRFYARGNPWVSVRPRD
jgi:hypothetical protein